jgi:hypothetical protein
LLARRAQSFTHVLVDALQNDVDRDIDHIATGVCRTLGMMPKAGGTAAQQPEKTSTLHSVFLVPKKTHSSGKSQLRRHQVAARPAGRRPQERHEADVAG